MEIVTIIPHKTFNSFGEEVLENLDYRIPVDEKFKDLDPYILNSLLLRAFRWSLKAISLNPSWIQEVEKESRLEKSKLQKSLEKLKFRTAEISKKPRRSPEEAFFLLQSGDRISEIEFLLKI